VTNVRYETLAKAQHRTILLVEDDPIVALAEKVDLEECGYVVLTAGNGEAAMETVRTVPEVDLVLMDIDLGTGIDGTEAARRILEVRDLPVVFLSSHTEPEFAKQTEEITSYGYVVKYAGTAVLDASITMAFRLFEARARLFQERRILQSIVDTIPVMITRYDPRTRVQYLNAEFERKTGWRSDEIADVDLMERVYPDPDYRRAVQAYMQRAVCEWREFDLRTKSGSTITSKWSNILLEDGTQIGIGIDVTADKIAMQRLRAHEQRFESMFDQHHAVMLLIEPETGSIRGANRSALRFYGYSRDDLLRMRIQDINTMSPEKIAELRALAEREQLSHFVFPHRLSSGETRTVEVHSSPIPTEDGVLLFSIIHDITERRRVEEALTESEAEFRKIFEIATVGIVQVNPAIGRVLRCNEKYETITGYSEPELLELSFRELTHPEDREWDWEVFSRAARGETPFYFSEKRYVRKDGETIWVRLNASFVRDPEGRPIRSVAVCEDITEHRNAQEQIRELLAEKETLLKEVQHRVKNTMHTMASILSLEASRLTDPSAVAALNDTESRFTSMEVLYDHLYRTESHESASVSDYLTSLVRSVADLFPQRDRIRIAADIDDIALDAKRLSALGMVVNELVTNALKYAYLDRDRGLLTITGRVEAERLTVTVADDGPGLPDSFDPDSANSYGLTMVRALTDQLNGTIRFERDGGTRAVVEFGLP